MLFVALIFEFNKPVSLEKKRAYKRKDNNSFPFEDFPCKRKDTTRIEKTKKILPLKKPVREAAYCFFQRVLNTAFFKEY